ncbi:mitochondrial RNA pseudouridine synthase RPUSD4 [Rhinatrema bivittatum]|uniref:mitochondrial RNA pseudouridine synthase RPUSD4 n=1 Tax=Rhinatrema bivittatum TaxID=194408 RepID=UPI0011279BF5|nr:mitochondrial RNA pseudouridine synthase RPUSD4 [Rhinatrema bivittatum]
MAANISSYTCLAGIRSFWAQVRPLQHAGIASRAAEAGEPGGAQRLAEQMREEKRKSRVRKETIAESPVQRQVKKLIQLTQQLQRVHPNVLAKALARGVVYQDKEIVVVDKPYGVPVHGGPGVHTSISDVLPVLAKILFGPKGEPLHLCHRLDKETTGAMVLAQSEKTAEYLQHLFRTRQVLKKYWAVSLGIPVPSEGFLEIPILEKQILGPQPHYKMTLAPNYRICGEDGKLVKMRKSCNAHSAVTQYRVLDSAGSCALLELHPITGVKHQLRVHLAFGLGCPILGDHKYSHWNTLAPQKLPIGTLKKLGLEQAKARHLPVHLHACHLSLPILEGQKDVSLVCKPPRFFLNSLKQLNLEIPQLSKD